MPYRQGRLRGRCTPGVLRCQAYRSSPRAAFPPWGPCLQPRFPLLLPALEPFVGMRPCDADLGRGGADRQATTHEQNEPHAAQYGGGDGGTVAEMGKEDVLVDGESGTQRRVAATHS